MVDRGRQDRPPQAHVAGNGIQCTNALMKNRLPEKFAFELRSGTSGEVANFWSIQMNW
jgi:hypothetical protein